MEEVRTAQNDKRVRLYDLRTSEGSRAGTTRLTLSCETAQGTHDLWFEVDDRYARYLSDDRCDYAIVAILTTAMRFGYTCIDSDIPISEQLFYNLQYHVIPQFASMDEDDYPELELRIPTCASTFSGTAVGAGMSGGVDSFSTLYEYGHHGVIELDGYRLTHLAYNNVGAHHGSDIRLGKSELSSRELFEGQLEKIRRFCDEHGYELVVTDSNLAPFLLAAFGHVYFSRFHTFRNAAAAMVLQKMYKLYYYSSARNLTGFKFSFRVPSAAYEKWLLPYLNTGSMAFYNSNQAWGRLEKTERISELSESWDYLTVCLLGIDNCGKCDKCRETLMALDVLGAGILDRYAASFDVERYRAEDREQWFSQIYELKDKPSFYQHDMQEIFDYGVAHGFPLIGEPPAFDEEYPDFTFARTRARLVNIRKLPSLHAQVIKRIRKENYPIACIARYQDWYKLRLADGSTGYAKTRLFNLRLPQSPESPRSAVVVKETYLREAPSMEASKTSDKLEPRSRATIRFSSGAWWYVELADGKSGFVPKRCVKLQRTLRERLRNKIRRS